MIPGSANSGYGNYPLTQPWRSSLTPPPSHSWSPASSPWQHTPQFRGGSSSQRNVGRPQSAFGDYRPNIDAIYYPRPDTPSNNLQTTQSPLSEFDKFTWEQLMGMSPGPPETPSPIPIQGRMEVPVPTRLAVGTGCGVGGGRGGSSDSRGGETGAAATVGAAAARAAARPTVVEGRPGTTRRRSLLLLQKAWGAITSDVVVGTD